MAIEVFMEKLPEADREAFKTELGNYVPKAELEKYVPLEGLEKSPVFQSKLSLKHEESMAKWQKEKLPTMIEEEIKKRGTKDPTTLEIEKLREEIAAEKRSGLLKERKAQAIQELSKHGIDAELAEFVISDDEEKFNANIKTLVGKFTSLRDEAVKKAKTEAYGQTPPKGGDKDPSIKTLPRAEFNALPEDKKREFIKSGGQLA
jgi:hypothetical protein